MQHPHRPFTRDHLEAKACLEQHERRARRPRLWGARRLYSERLVEVHFWIATLGIVLYITAMWVSGIMQGLMWRATSNMANVEIEHFDREMGESGYTLKRLVQLWSVILNFSMMPLRTASVLGSVMGLVGLLAAIVIVISKFADPTMQAGWPSMMAAIAIVGAVLLAGEQQTTLSTVLGAIAVFASMTNIVSGFLITDRMLKMFKKREPGQ